ncbi:T9SS type A sorting domain-containing protein, partial [bacterium]|nr:T9SS type A sorting domain-containing protein [bacterium]
RLSVPEQVTGLTAEGDCGQITLTWQPLAGNVASYLIYRDLIPQPIATIDAAVAQYADSGVADSYGHIYRVQAENICGLSENSEVTIGSLLPLFSFEQLLPDTVYCLQYLNVLTRYCPGTDSVEFSLSEANGPFTSFGGQAINEPEPITIMIPDVGRVIEQARLMVVSFRDLRIDTTISEHFILDCMLDIDETPLPIPEAFYLSQNFPNPFNASTMIVYDLPAAVHAVMKVYDVMGREVSELVNGMQSAGRHEVRFDAGSLTSGIYFCRFEAGDFTAVRKMVLMK